MTDRLPRYHTNQVLRITHSWARDLPLRPVLDVMWDDEWQTYTYSFPCALIQIEEEWLEPTDLPDMTPLAWAESRPWNVE